MVNAQEWLDKNYPKQGRSEIKNLDISNKDLEGELTLDGFTNLVYLNCFDNQLTEINFSSLSSEKVRIINIANNNLSLRDLSFLSRFANLEELYVHNNSQSKIDRGIINRWHGSLEPLKNMNKLKKLEISQTDLENGLEYLPGSLETIWCYCGQRPSSLCRSMHEQLKNCESGGHQDFGLWRSIQIQELKTQLEQEKKKNADLEEKLTQLEAWKQKHLNDLKEQTKQFSTVIEYQIAEKQEQINNLLTSTPLNQEKIALIQEEIKVLQTQLMEVEKPEQRAQILHQPYGIPSSSRGDGH